MKNKYVVFDSESNGLLHNGTVIHCIVLKTYDEKWTPVEIYYDGPYMGRLRKGTIAQGIERLCELAFKEYILCGHNICGFDLPFFRKMGHIHSILSPMSNLKMLDTMTASCLREPETPHNLDYYGKRFGMTKPAHEDWSILSKEMLHRCSEDVRINCRLLEYFVAKGIEEPEFHEAMILENQVAYIHAWQTDHGMRVDVLRAESLIHEIDAKLGVLEKELHAELPKTVTVTGELKRPFTKDGSLSRYVKEWYKDTEYIPVSGVIMPLTDCTMAKKGVRIGGPLTRIEFEPVNLGSHPKVKKLLLELGWQPTEYNYKKDKSGRFMRDQKGKLIQMSPKLTEDSYDSLPPGVGSKLAEFLKLQHRRRFIANETAPSKRGLISHIREDGRVPCDALTCGTNTARYRHMGAFVNLPKPGVFYGSEIRSLYCVDRESLLLGMDLDGIEARMMAHYAKYYDGGAYEKIVMGGDVHQNNADALGCDRDTAKTFLYAISYGAKTGKLASILGCSFSEADEKIEDFWEANSGLRKLILALEAEYASRGYITGLDGRPLYIRQEHKLMNTLIQNAAAIVFKRWMVKCYKYTSKFTMINQVLAYHDELGWEVSSTNQTVVRSYARNFQRFLSQVQKELGITVMLGAGFKIGQRYSEVH